MFRPLILFNGKVFLTSWFEGLDNLAVVAVNESGMMDPVTLVGYFEKEIVPKLVCSKVDCATLVTFAVVICSISLLHSHFFLFLERCLLRPALLSCIQRSIHQIVH